MQPVRHWPNETDNSYTTKEQVVGKDKKKDKDLEKATGTDVAVIDDLDTGLEDFDAATDSVMPRLRIVGKDAQFEDNLTSERFDQIDVILLGLVKQRILWAPEVDDGEGPLCKSLDFKIGLPYVKEFPWKESGFKKPKDYDHETDPQPELPCASCALKEWGTNPTSSTPWCSEQHTYPLLLKSGDLWLPAILTLQRSGIKPSKAYVSGFARTRTPLYTTITRISLQAQKRGSVDYAVPILAKVEPTAESSWPEYAHAYRQIRTYLQTPRQDEPEATTAPTAAATSGGETPSYADDDEPPF